MSLATATAAGLIGRAPQFKVLGCSFNLRVPVCKVLYLPLNLNVKITFYGGQAVSVHASIWMDFFGLPVDHTQYFLLFMRHWFDMSPLKGTGFNKVLDLLALYFLQQQDICTNYYERIYNVGRVALADFRTCVIPFFEFYRKFDFRKYVVCPLLGSQQVVQREHLLNYDALAL